MSDSCLLEELIREWHLKLEAGPIQTFSSNIYHVRRQETRLILKIYMQDRSDNSSALNYFSGHGAVRAFEHRPGKALLMEHALPGQQLLSVVQDGRSDEAMHVLCKVIAALHSQPCPSKGFGALAERLRYFDCPAAKSLSISPGWLNHARALFSDLIASQSDMRLCHADLHYENILYDDQRGWLAIDPLGVIAERTFDFSGIMRYPWLNTSLVERWSAIASEQLGLNCQRLYSWVFCDNVVLAIWAEQRGLNPKGFLTAAGAAWPLVR